MVVLLVLLNVERENKRRGRQDALTPSSAIHERSVEASDQIDDIRSCVDQMAHMIRRLEEDNRILKEELAAAKLRVQIEAPDARSDDHGAQGAPSALSVFRSRKRAHDANRARSFGVEGERAAVDSKPTSSKPPEASIRRPREALEGQGGASAPRLTRTV